MKTKQSRLPFALQIIFLIMEGVMFGVTILIVTLVLFLNKPVGEDGGARLSVDLSIGEVGIELPSESYALLISGDEPVQAQFDDVHGTISITDPALAEKISIVTRQTIVTFILLFGVTGTVLCELFKRLFRNVNRGDTFTEFNIKNVQRIGIIILVVTFAGGLLNGWVSYKSARFIRQNIEVSGVEIDASPHAEGGLSIDINDFLLDFSLTGILSGLMILALGEAFRQGLRLKQDTELTI